MNQEDIKIGAIVTNPERTATWLVTGFQGELVAVKGKTGLKSLWDRETFDRAELVKEGEG